MPNLDLLERIARGERRFGVDAFASGPVQAEFDELVDDALDLDSAGYTTGALPQKHSMRGDAKWYALVIRGGITSAGIDALRRAGRDVTGLSADA